MAENQLPEEAPLGPAEDDPMAGECPEETQWQILGFYQRDLLIQGPDSQEYKDFVIRGLGYCAAVGNLNDVIGAFNLIADSQFSENEVFWKIGTPAIEIIDLASDHIGECLLAPAVGRALRIDVGHGELNEACPLELIYHDPSWGERIPVHPGAHYGFGLKLQGCLGRNHARVRFLDPKGEEVGVAECLSVRLAEKADGDEAIYAYSLNAVVPAKAAWAQCVIEFEIDHNVYDRAEKSIFLAEPVLRMMSKADPLDWLPEASNRAALCRLWQFGNRKIYRTPYTGDAPRLENDVLELSVDGDASAVASIQIEKARPRSMIIIRPQEGSTIPVRVRNYEGAVSLKIDGQEVSSKYFSQSDEDTIYRFKIPDTFFDDDYHTIELLDRKRARMVARDLHFLASNSTHWRAIEKQCMPPLPSHLSPRSANWMRAMERQIAYFGSRETMSAQDKWLLRNLSRIEQVLVNGMDKNKDFFALHFPEHNRPMVSIIVPAHNAYHVTFQCLCSLLFARNETAFEVIVVNDGSTDQTSERLGQHEGIKVVSRKNASGYGEACHAGADKARGQYLLFLNNDVEVTAGWLDELVKVFEIFPETGAAASKLLFPNGRLQDAGGLVLGDGTPVNYGRLHNPADPRFCYSRDTDYVSGAALITPRAVWKEVGGFAEELRPAYFEDVWYSFAVRELGLRTIFCAPSNVYHVEGVSNGADVNAETGLKRFQKLNHPKFKRRWADIYEKHGDPAVSRDLQKDRTTQIKILMLGWSTPTPDQDAGNYAMVEEIKMLQRLGCKITFAPINGKYLGRYTQELQRLGVETIYEPFFNSVEELLQKRGRQFDVVWVSHYSVLEPLIEKIRKYASKAKLMLNLVDLHFLRAMRAARTAQDSEAMRMATEVREQELATIERCDVTLSYSDVEIDMLRELLDDKVVLGRLPWVQPVFEGQPAFADRQNLCFLGSSGHPPNSEAVNYFAASVLPLVWAKNSAMRFHVYGPKWEDRADIDDNVDILGFAPDLQAMFAQYRIFVAPLKSGAGIKGKVLMAMATGIPCILSPMAAEGIGVVHGQHCLIAESDQEWADAVARLDRDEELWTRIGTGGQVFIAEDYSLDKGIDQMRSMLEQANVPVRS